jgi:hypothetical protein
VPRCDEAPEDTPTPGFEPGNSCLPSGSRSVGASRGALSELTGGVFAASPLLPKSREAQESAWLSGIRGATPESYSDRREVFEHRRKLLAASSAACRRVGEDDGAPSYPPAGIGMVSAILQASIVTSSLYSIPTATRGTVTVRWRRNTTVFFHATPRARAHSPSEQRIKRSVRGRSPLVAMPLVAIARRWPRRSGFWHREERRR